MENELPLPKDTTGLVIYGSENCKFCDKAKNKITTYGKDYIYHDVNNFGGITKCLDDLSHLTNNQRTIPVIFDDGNFIGGYKELEQHIEKTFIIEPMYDDF
jgi:glutaredoxin